MKPIQILQSGQAFYSSSKHAALCLDSHGRLQRLWANQVLEETTAFKQATYGLYFYYSKTAHKPSVLFICNLNDKKIVQKWPVWTSTTLTQFMITVDNQANVAAYNVVTQDLETHKHTVYNRLPLDMFSQK